MPTNPYERVQCVGCGGWPNRDRLTLPRAKTGDLIFCGYHCLKAWEDRRDLARIESKK